MTRRRRPVIAIAMTLAAMVLTIRASAQDRPPQDTLSPAVASPSAVPTAPSLSSSPLGAESSTPLALRPARTLALATEPPRSAIGWNIAAVVAVGLVSAFYFRKRRQPRRLDDAQLTIVRRAPVGLRSELVVVNVEGQRLLLGVTPHSIQSLAVLDFDEETAAAPALASSGEATSVNDRFAAMLRAADGRTDAKGDPDDSAVAGQARGLLGLRRRG